MQIYHHWMLWACLPNPPHPATFLPATTCAARWRIGFVFDAYRKGGRKSGWRWSANWIEPMSRQSNARAGTCRWRTLSDWRRRWKCLSGPCSCRWSRMRGRALFSNSTLSGTTVEVETVDPPPAPQSFKAVTMKPSPMCLMVVILIEFPAKEVNCVSCRKNCCL